MALRKIAVPAAVALFIAGCSLYNDVSIGPLILNPAQIERGSDVQAMVNKSDFLRAIEFRPVVEARQRKSAAELMALGTAEMASGRYDEARRHLREALDLQPFRETTAHIEWALSQVEYMCNNFEPALDWAQAANSHGMAIKQWHIDYLTALAHTNVYKYSGLPSSQIPMRASRPDVPRIDVRINGRRSVNAVIDSGAVLSIVSERFAAELSVHKLGQFRGEFFGLLGEPISVQFGLLDSVTLGDIVLENVPVAIMPDDEMRFVVAGKREFKIDFLLGANFLKEFRTDLDFPRGVVTFYHLTSEDRRPATDQNLFVQGFRPYVRGTVNRRGWYMFVLDTGSEVTFLNDLQMMNLPLGNVPPRAHNAMLQGLGGTKKRGAKIDNVEIGADRWAGTFRTVPMYSAGEQESAAGIVGENFLKNFRVVLDYGRMRLDLLRGSESYLPPKPAMVTAGAR
jgi:Aspartyl protease/Tetratricopeptide repeat